MSSTGIKFDKVIDSRTSVFSQFRLLQSASDAELWCFVSVFGSKTSSKINREVIRIGMWCVNLTSKSLQGLAQVPINHILHSKYFYSVLAIFCSMRANNVCFRVVDDFSRSGSPADCGKGNVLGANRAGVLRRFMFSYAWR